MIKILSKNPFAAVMLSLSALMLINMGFARLSSAQQGEIPSEITFVQEYCFDGLVNEMDLSALTKVYQQKTNTYFNENIKEIMNNPQANVRVPNANDYANSSQLCGANTDDYACKMISVCENNSSAFCLGVNTLGFTPEKFKNYDTDKLEKSFKQLRYSYFCYKTALELKGDQVAENNGTNYLKSCDLPDETKAEIAEVDEQFLKICEYRNQMQNAGSEADQARARNLMNDLLKEKNYDFSLTVVGANMEANATYIERELMRSKQALEMTIEAYSQLRDAWKMHVQYVDIYQELVKYRDGLMQVRKQTEVFPFRFIDASTTMCK